MQDETREKPTQPGWRAGYKCGVFSTALRAGPLGALPTRPLGRATQSLRTPRLVPAVAGIGLSHSSSTFQRPTFVQHTQRQPST